MDKNYFVAFALTLLILFGYPKILKMLGIIKPGPVEITAQQSAPAAPGVPSEAPKAAAPASQTAASAVTSAAGSFLENPAPPALVRAETPAYEIDFSSLGGTVTRLFFRGEHDKPEKTSSLFYDGSHTEPGIFGLRIMNENVDLSKSIFKIVRQEKGIYEFAFEKPGDYRLTKTYVLDQEKPAMKLEVAIENLSAIEKNYPLELELALHYKKEDHQAQAAALGEKVIGAKPDKIIKKGFTVSEKIQWGGVAKKYFTILAKPDISLIGCVGRVTDDHTLWNTLRTEPAAVAPGQKTVKTFMIYAGPQKYEYLKDFGFEAIFSQGFFGMFKLWLLLALKFLYGFSHNYGWAIILLTIGLKGLFTPLTHMSYESMKKMQAIQPKMKSLQERYKNDPQKLNREMMDLYRRNKVNPMSGCLPMLLQIPIFISFYQVLDETIELKGAEFIWWIHDLAQPDKLLTFPFEIPFLGDGLNLLPLLMIGSMIWQQKLTPQPSTSPEQAQVMAMMPIIFGFFFYKMPSGLVLYWFVNNMLTIIHQTFIKRMVIKLHHEDSE